MHSFVYLCVHIFIYLFIHLHPYILVYKIHITAMLIYIYIYVLMHLVPGSLNILPGCSLISRRPILARYASMPAKFTQDDEVGDCRFAVQCMS